MNYLFISRDYLKDFIMIQLIHPDKDLIIIILKTVRSMINKTIYKFPNSKVQVVPKHPIILRQHNSWPYRTLADIMFFVLERLPRLLNSAEELDINKVTFEISIKPIPTGGILGKKLIDTVNSRSIRRIKNTDTICLARSIVTALADTFTDLTDSQKKHLKEGRPLQTKYAKDLHEQANVTIKQSGNNLDDVKIFENFLEIRILVFTYNHTDKIIYKGNENYKHQIYLYYHDEHFDVITSITGFLAVKAFCTRCLIGYIYQHTCEDKSLHSISPQWTCEKCKKTFVMRYEKPETHICNMKTCLTCHEKFRRGNSSEQHQCYMIKPKSRKLKEPKYIFFDFEAIQETGIHEMNFCIAYDYYTNTIYKMQTNSIVVYKCDFSIENISLDNSDLQQALQIKTEKVLMGSTIELFCKTFITNNFIGYTFISHYGKGYDLNPILAWLIKNKHNPHHISSGLKITYLEIAGIRFIDSINFTLCALSKFPETFGFKGNKGYFPHYFNTSKNQEYIGKYPELKDYGYDEMNKKSKEALEKWYDTIKDKKFNFQKEIFYYCLLDVLILAKGCSIYRKIFLEITKNTLDPFQFITIAQFCNKIYKTMMMPEKTIGIHKTSTFEDNQSYKAIQWLEYLASKNNITIRHSKRGGEKIIYVNNK